MNRPTIVCLCGSTRFPDAWKTAHREESLAGRIVLSVGVMIHAGDKPIRTDGPEKRLLDELHFRKIELADEILVLNVGGYIGYSTGREIAHAKSLGKRVRYLEAEPQEERPATAERTLLAPLWAGDGPGQTVSGPAASLREAEPQEAGEGPPLRAPSPREQLDALKSEGPREEILVIDMQDRRPPVLRGNHVHTCPECSTHAPCEDACGCLEDMRLDDGTERGGFVVCDECREALQEAGEGPQLPTADEVYGILHPSHPINGGPGFDEEGRPLLPEAGEGPRMLTPGQKDLLEAVRASLSQQPKNKRGKRAGEGGER